MKCKWAAFILYCGSILIYFLNLIWIKIKLWFRHFKGHVNNNNIIKLFKVLYPKEFRKLHSYRVSVLRKDPQGNRTWQLGCVSQKSLGVKPPPNFVTNQPILGEVWPPNSFVKHTPEPRVVQWLGASSVTQFRRLHHLHASMCNYYTIISWFNNILFTYKIHRQRLSAA